MKVKIDTKEKFHVITPLESTISANMTDDFKNELLSFLEKKIKNLIINLSQVSAVDKNSAEMIVVLQKRFYDDNASFVICEMQKSVQKIFEQLKLLHVINIAPTESEAWDIVQMEEIERELLN
jgi:anti-anti-sigma factor